MSYKNQANWKEIMSHLPKQYQLTDEQLPVEEYWSWKGHQVHLDTYLNPTAKAKVILFHGVGTNGRQMATILGHFLSQQNYEVIAIDMPIYGETILAKGSIVTYSDWVQIGSDYIDEELGRDNRKIFLYGLSAGGMETYHVAARNKKVSGIIGMTFLDQRDQTVRNVTTKNWFYAHSLPLMKLANKLGMRGMPVKMSRVSKMDTLVNDKAALDAMLRDKTSAGNSVNQAFLEDYMTFSPDIEPEDFDVCPIILTQPEKDRWTPEFLSQPFLAKITKVSTEVVHLRNGSHYPIEAEAIEDLQREALKFIEKHL